MAAARVVAVWALSVEEKAAARAAAARAAAWRAAAWVLVQGGAEEKKVVREATVEAVAKREVVAR